jgi:hypothetical protein
MLFVFEMILKMKKILLYGMIVASDN